MLTNADEFIAQWAPKVGDEAARLRWRSSVQLLIAYLSNFVWIPCVIAGLEVPSPALLAVGIAVAVSGSVLVVVSSLKLRAANRLTSELLGLELGFGHINPPPRERGHYEKWCQKHGITPYAAAGMSATNRDKSRPASS